jgi:phospholipid transport system substrate-binding protein
MKIRTAGALAALTIFFAAGAIASTQPKAQLEDTMERVMAVTKSFNSEQDFIDNKPRLRAIIMPRFDFAEMARRSLGSDWHRVQGREDEFVAVFVSFAEGSYMNALGSYRGERMTYGREQIDQDFAQVDTQVWGSSGEATPIVYKMRRVGGDWKVYDVVIDDVSLTSNFRSQFGRILKKDSVDELMRKLRAKAPTS